MPPCAPVGATTATVNSKMWDEIVNKLDMAGCCMVTESPNNPHIHYKVVQKKTIEEDFENVVRDVAENSIKAQRVVVYCQTLDICESLYSHFLHVVQDATYYRTGAEQISDNWLFGMFHSCTDDHNKMVIISSLSQTDGSRSCVCHNGSFCKVLLSHLKTTFRRVAELAEITNNLCPEFTGNQLKFLYMQIRLFIIT